MEQELVKKAQAGCMHSYCKLVCGIREQAYRIAFCYLKNSEDSMDAVCDAVEKAWNGIKKLKNVEFFNTWFIRIVINECKRKLKTGKRTVLIDDLREMKAYNSESYEQTLRVDLKLDLQDILENIKPSDRTMLYMRYYMDYPLEHISKIIGIPLSTAKTRIYTALKKLKACVKEESKL